jgi:sugar lactone lactonase YvrE
VINSVAGNKSLGFSGDGGLATAAQLNLPRSVTVDSAGNLYIADSENNRIRKVVPAGVITTVAGNGEQLFHAGGIALDSQGNLFIADLDDNQIRKVTPAGAITTVAGNGENTFVNGEVIRFGGDGGPAVSAQLNNPRGVAVDSGGNLYIADAGNDRIRKVTPAGVITTVAGGGLPVFIRGEVIRFSGDGGLATSAQLNHPTGVAVDSAGNLYIADTRNHRIRKVAPDGRISTIAGNGIGGFSGDGGLATSAQLARPKGVAVAAGNLYIAESLHIRKVTPDGVITTVVGNGTSGYSGDGIPAASAYISPYEGVAVDSAGNLYVADYIHRCIRKVLSVSR